MLSWVSAELTKGRTAAPFANYGERLYAEGRLAMQERAAAAEAFRTAREEDELEELRQSRFDRRKLDRSASAQSRAQAGVGDVSSYDNTPTGKMGLDTWQRLHSWWDEVKELQLAERRAEQQRQEDALCTFRPEISQRSREIAEARSEYTHRHRLGRKLHEELFQARDGSGGGTGQLDEFRAYAAFKNF